MPFGKESIINVDPLEEKKGLLQALTEFSFKV